MAKLGTLPRGTADFFTSDVFEIVLKDPATSGQLKRFCEASACGENLAFLEKVDQYSQVIQQARDLLSEIQATYISPDATDPVNLPGRTLKSVGQAIEVARKHTLPNIQGIFLDAPKRVQDLIREDTYPRFVTNQITAIASQALGNESRTAYQGLGDCFCLTDPNVADNVIVYASDGFIAVTGYSRHDIVPRNCRFMQGEKTDRTAVARLKEKIEQGVESVELLLNYRKDGSPFWNLLHVTPLRDEYGKIIFFLGGQIDCSSTVHSNPDVLKVLRFNDQRTSRQFHDQAMAKERGSGVLSHKDPLRWSRHLFRLGGQGPQVQQGVGLESEIVERIGKMSLEAQMSTFHTAYANYLVLQLDARGNLNIAFYSDAAVRLLDISRTNEITKQIRHEDVFKILFERSHSSSWILNSFRKTVTTHIKQGKAVSLNFALLSQESGKHSDKRGSKAAVEKLVVTHWTPCKDEAGRTKYVVLLFSDN